MKFTEFLTQKGITDADYKAKTAEEMASLFNEFNEVSREALKALIEAKASKEDISSLKDEIVNNQIEQMKQLNATLKEHGLAITKLVNREGGQPTKLKTIADSLTENIEKLKLFKGNDKAASQGAGFTIKASGTILGSTNVSGGNVPVEQRIDGLDRLATRQPRLLEVLARGTATSNVISWVSQANRDGNAGGTVEGAAKNQIDFDLVVVSKPLVKRTAFIKISTEMMDDIAFIESEINNELTVMLLKDVENTAFSGNGTAPNLEGVYTVAPLFAAGTFATSIATPNEVDVLVVAQNQIAIAEQPEPNYIFMHPSDVTKLKLKKLTTTDYNNRLQLIGGSMIMDGIPIIKTTLVTVGTFLMGSFSMATLYEKGTISINIGMDGNDFTNNLVTILAEWRGLLITKTNARTAFVKGTFSTAITALTAA